jgi:hypothetical protein
MEQQFDEVMRLTASIKQGTVTASLILRKLAAYPRQNSLAMGAARIRTVGADSVHPQMASGSGAPSPSHRRHSIREKRAMRSRGPCSFIASARSAIAPMKTNATAPAA